MKTPLESRDLILVLWPLIRLSPVFFLVSYSEDDMTPLLVDLSVFSGMMLVTDTPTRREEKTRKKFRISILIREQSSYPPLF
jgi:hypothetical protein